MKRLLILILLLFFSCGFSKNFVKISKKAIESDRFINCLATGFIIAHSYTDATADAIQFSSGREIYGCNHNQWHRWKNLSRGYLFGYGFCKGLLFGKAILEDRFFDELKFQIKRGTGDVGLAFPVWQGRYKYCRYNLFPDYKIEHNEHRYVIPVDKDRYLPFNKPYIHLMVDIGLLGWGTYIFIKH